MKKKVLVIDDDPDVFATLKLRLESFGLEVYAAADSAEGLQKAKEISPQLIILDYTIGEESGIEVLKQLKAGTDNWVKKIPVLMLTGHEGHEKSCMEAGATGYLTKPFDLFQLKETISRLL